MNEIAQRQDANAPAAQIAAAQQRTLDALLIERKRYEDALRQIVDAYAPDEAAGSIARDALHLTR
jgi:hypothetical protein